MSRDSRDESQSNISANRWPVFAGFILTFFPVILAVVSFTLSAVFNWDDWLRANASAIWAAILMVFLAEFWRSDQSRRRLNHLLSEMNSRVAADITSHDCATSISRAFDLRKNPSSVRIFALSSYKIQPLVEQLIDKGTIHTVQLLLANPDEYYHDPSEIFSQEMSLAVEWKWLDMVRNRKISHLEVRHYNFYPTEWFILLDSEVAVFGDFDFEKNSVARAKTSNHVFVASNTGAGVEILLNLSTKFDYLFESCREEFGSNRYIGHVTSEQTLKTGKWPNSQNEN
jgi:hypothetical protein